MARNIEKAVEALLTTSTVLEASRQSGISVRTLFRWIKEPSFQEQLRQARQRAFNGALSRVCGASMEAADTLIKGVRGESITRTQYLSAKTLLEIAQAVQADDMIRRVENLEQQAMDRRLGRSPEFDAMSLEQLEDRLAQMRDLQQKENEADDRLIE